MIRAITEIGLAVHDLDQATALLVQRLQAVPGPEQRYEPYAMVYRMCRVGNVDFELMAPLGEGGVIAQFLQRHGEGLHHIGFAVDDVQAFQQDAQARGLDFVDPAPRRQRFLLHDFAGRQAEGEVAFAFNRPKSLLGVLAEFIQYPPGFALAAGAVEPRS